MGLPVFDQFTRVIEAVALGRAGDTAGADALITPTLAAIRSSPASTGMVQAVGLVTARAAIRDGWGDPVGWLRDSEAWFAERGFDRIVRRCRALLGEAGAPIPRRGRGESNVPESLRALGVTSREVDVLKLVVAGRTNKEIAAELFLSPKTVERHLTSLFDRTGVRNRRALAQVGVTHLPARP
jgi:DNA-binding CsgD family transcriptional regulator